MWETEIARDIERVLDRYETYRISKSHTGNTHINGVFIDMESLILFN